jgi:phenylpropionate dioxygenase-like ring-hydroxylating dioxygenase large terminal subunit
MSAPTIPASLTAAEQIAAYFALLDADSRVVPDVYRLTAPFERTQMSVPVERYISPEFHRLEVERLWKRVWQMACREEDLPDVGSYVVYEIAGVSVIVVRSDEDTITAHRNVCRHRGRTLKEVDGRADDFRCPFHGIAWNLDGTLKQMPCKWDFPQIEEPFSLLPVQVGTWGGFVFINLDPGAAPLEEHLGDLPQHFERWPLEDRYKQVHVGKVLRCNWKLAQEAFMESWHVIATHPQLLPSLGDTVSKYDVFGNVSRALTPNGIPSPHLRWEPTEQDILDTMVDRNLDEEPILVVPEGQTARQFTSDNRRRHLESEIGEMAQTLSDAEMDDSMVYTLFPNLHPWGSYNRIVYRFRPYGNHHDMSIMECMILSPFSGERPPSAPLHLLGPDDDWTLAPELGLLTRVFNQDGFNLPHVQKGLESGSLDEVVFAEYQETKIRHFHSLLEDWIV